MSRILFLTPQLPYPPHQGAAIRNLNLIKLASAEHEVRVCSFVRSEEEAQLEGALDPWVKQVRTSLAPRQSLPERALWTAFSVTPDMGRRLQSADFAGLLDQADVVQAEGIEMAQYLEGLTGPTVLDCHNAEWLLQRRTFEVDFKEGKLVGAAYSAMQWLKLRRYERQACQGAAAVMAVSEDDRQALLQLNRKLDVDVVPNGVDATFFQPSGESTAADSVVFTGTLDFRPNVDAVLWLAGDIWPLVREELPDARLTLAGRAPLPVIRRLGGSEGIEIAASPPDIRPYFSGSSVYVVPVRSGGGSRYKLLQAMSMAMGIVSTSIGAEGIDVRDGEHLIIADEPESFAAAVVELARDKPLRDRLGGAARELVLRQYDWPVIGPRLLAVYERLLAAPGK